MCTDRQAEIIHDHVAAVSAELEQARAEAARLLAIIDGLRCTHRAYVPAFPGTKCEAIDPGNESGDWCPTCRAKLEARAV